MAFRRSSSSRNFNPRSPYGERPYALGTLIREGEISIHAPLTGSDERHAAYRPRSLYFNPRSPYGERPASKGDLYMATTISIHAPLTGSDSTNTQNRPRAGDFNPRSPYGERPTGRKFQYSRPNFNPRSPYGERHFNADVWSHSKNISIHAPLTGSDSKTAQNFT